MCRNQKFLHIWHVSDVENVSTYVQFMLFCCKIDFVTICALLSENLFCRDLRTFVWRKIEPKIASVEKKWQIWGMIPTCSDDGLVSAALLANNDQKGQKWPKCQKITKKLTLTLTQKGEPECVNNIECVEMPAHLKTYFDRFSELRNVKKNYSDQIFQTKFYPPRKVR